MDSEKKKGTILMGCVDQANPTQKSNVNEHQSSTIDLYIGVFFDGTGNNKYQVMLGKMFRGKEALANVKGLDGNPLKIGDARKMGREELKKRGLSETQLDEIFFGYGNGIRKENTFFVEDSIHSADLLIERDTTYDSAVLNTQNNFDLYRQATIEYKSGVNNPGLTKKEWGKLKSNLGEGGSIQESTYSNVAILESLYKNDNNKYFSIYIEGAGTDTNMGWWGGNLNIRGAGIGTGDTGVWMKVKKAASSVDRLCRKYIKEKSVTKVILHMSIFGFSRGATEARMFAYIFNPQNANIESALRNIDRREFLNNKSEVEKQLDFVGLFDTVSSYGVDFSNDVDELHLYGVQNAQYTLHLCAMDEFRDNFALTDIRSAWDKGLELYIPGCHTDIGGGMSIGVSEWKEIKQSQQIESDNSEKRYYGHGNLQTIRQRYLINKWGWSNVLELSDVSIETLKTMGWLSPNSIDATHYRVTDREIESIGSAHNNEGGQIYIKRYVKPGYSNIPLNLMHKKAIERGILFSAMPLSYNVTQNSCLFGLYERWQAKLGENGRQFIDISNEEYCNLRREYLQYSADDSSLVNSPYRVYLETEQFVDKYLITRRIYEGIINSQGQNYSLSELAGNTSPN